MVYNTKAFIVLRVPNLGKYEFSDLNEIIMGACDPGVLVQSDKISLLNQPASPHAS